MKQWARKVTLNPFVEYLIGPGLLFLGGIVEGGVWRAGVGLPGFLLVAGSRYFGNRAREQSDAGSTILRLLTVMVNTFVAARPAPKDRSLRANLLLLDRERDALRIAYYTPGYESGELQLRWRRGQGCAGEAWEKQETVFAPTEAELPVKVGSARGTPRPWNMTSEQIRQTAETISSVLSVPVFLPNGDFAGALNLDDSKDLAESLLSSPDTRAAVEGLAREIGTLLQKAGTELPEDVG